MSIHLCSHHFSPYSLSSSSYFSVWSLTSISGTPHLFACKIMTASLRNNELQFWLSLCSHHFWQSASHFNCMNTSCNDITFKCPLCYFFFAILHNCHLLSVQIAENKNIQETCTQSRKRLCTSSRLMARSMFMGFANENWTLHSRSMMDNDIARIFSYTSPVYVERIKGRSRFGMYAAEEVGTMITC